MTADLDTLGPIDYLVVEFPADTVVDGEALGHLVDLEARGIIRILDLALIARQADGSVVALELTDERLASELGGSLLAESASGLLDDDDLAEAGSALEPGAVAAVLIYENTWAAPFAVALRRKGAQLVASGRVPVQALLATLDALEGAS